MKECILEVASAFFEEKKDDVAAIRGIPMSARSNTRRMEILATDIKSTLLELLEKAPCYAIALDESCDIVDDEKISIFVRFFDIENKIFREELLAILPLKVSLSTGGTPSMTGKEKGVVKKIRDQNPGLISYQCIIHQTALYGKLSATLKK
ncbi:protein FAM200A-like [Schistocerca piceifrons]|uniref:protein FAM200A-like n=1 Tax=Schistocerca piceifrons TaxID=274613 RepID=UPI001F5FCE33|nr:protein FAM200A-like [Schistocerca piceifrons]